MHSESALFQKIGNIKDQVLTELVKCFVSGAMETALLSTSALDIGESVIVTASYKTWEGRFGCQCLAFIELSEGVSCARTEHTGLYQLIQ